MQLCTFDRCKLPSAAAVSVRVSCRLLSLWLRANKVHWCLLTGCAQRIRPEFALVLPLPAILLANLLSQKALKARQQPPGLPPPTLCRQRGVHRCSVHPGPQQGVCWPRRGEACPGQAERGHVSGPDHCSAGCALHPAHLQSAVLAASTPRMPADASSKHAASPAHVSTA